jgi:hypothetical protein
MKIAARPNLALHDAGQLVAMPSELPVLAFLATCPDRRARRAEVEAAVGSFYAGQEALEAAIKASAQSVETLRGGKLRLTDSGLAKCEDALGKLAGRSWAELQMRALVGLALGLEPKASATSTYLARRDNVESAALGLLYAATEPGATPTRAETRFALLRRLILARMPECEPALMETPMQNASRDVIGRAVMLGAAGMTQGTMRDAEKALLQKALGLTSDSREELVEALIRASLGRNTPRLPLRIRIESAAQELTGFAKTVRELAKTLRTAPFEGRVAIAQVYDAGIASGLDFGALDDFKSRVTAACRAGMLDLERYDIAGPMDSTLRERSRTAFGRDERHFIVNEWI